MTSLATTHSRAWSPRRPKSSLRFWARYCVQWVWGPPVWLLVRIPIILLTLLEVDIASSSATPGSKARWRRRLWVDRERLRLDRIADPREQEREWRQLLTDRSLNCVPPRPGAPAPLPCSGGVHRLDADDSFFRLIGAGRALDIAGSEFGWVLAPGAEKDLPTWLRLRCPERLA